MFFFLIQMWLTQMTHTNKSHPYVFFFHPYVFFFHMGKAHSLNPYE